MKFKLRRGVDFWIGFPIETDPSKSQCHAYQLYIEVPNRSFVPKKRRDRPGPFRIFSKYVGKPWFILPQCDPSHQFGTRAARIALHMKGAFKYEVFPESQM